MSEVKTVLLVAKNEEVAHKKSQEKIPLIVALTAIVCIAPVVSELFSFLITNIAMIGSVLWENHFLRGLLITTILIILLKLTMSLLTRIFCRDK